MNARSKEARGRHRRFPIASLKAASGMGTMGRSARLLMVFVTTFALGGCAAMRRQQARDTGDLLVAAGFTAKPADTPERAQRLEAIPPLKVVSQQKDGHVLYRYADPYSCHCLYVGNEQAYAEYRRLAVQKQIADERLEAAEAEDGALVDWDLWGPGPWW
jgi:hypothetical protein